MKPIVLITHYVAPSAINLLGSVCDIMPRLSLGSRRQQELEVLAGCAQALLAVSPIQIGESILRNCPRLQVIACAFRTAEAIDMVACARRGIWVTTTLIHETGTEAELEAARNILDVISGDTPRGAINTADTLAAML